MSYHSTTMVLYTHRYHTIRSQPFNPVKKKNLNPKMIKRYQWQSEAINKGSKTPHSVLVDFVSGAVTVLVQVLVCNIRETHFN